MSLSSRLRDPTTRRRSVGNIKVERATYEWIARQAKTYGMTRTEVIRTCIEWAMEEVDPNEEGEP